MTLDDLGRIAPRYNALAALTEERALKEAARADRRLARGAASDLCGIPYGAKDLFDARGAPTTWGAIAFKDRRVETDATVIKRLASAGGILAAKLAMAELAGGGAPRFPGASLFGLPRNPWDPARYSGGSSSGSGICVAAGLLSYALGTETGGSVLTPSAFSGVTGLRPTYGLVPRTGVMALSWTLDKVGVLARTARDCATVLAAIAGPDRRDDTAVGKRFHPLDTAADLRKVRIAYAGTDVDEAAPQARETMARGIEELLRLVPTVVRVVMPDDVPDVATLETVMRAEAATLFAEQLEDPAFRMADEQQLEHLRSGLRVTAREYLQAMRERTFVIERFRAVFREADVIVSVGRPGTAPLLDKPYPPRSGATVADRLRTAANLAGVPGVFFPCGLALDGLPVGLQLVGPPFSEGLLLAIAEAYQRDTRHHLLRPPVD